MAARLFLIAAFLMLAPAVRAGDVTSGTSDLSDTSDFSDTAPAPASFTTTYELDADTSYVGDARTNLGSGNRGDVSEERTDTHLVVATENNDGPIYRFGLGYQRYSFGLSRASPIPNVLEAENLVIGVDFHLFDSWLIRVEADPGLYSDSRSLGFRDFNVPVFIGGSYIAGADLQWVLGLDLDVNRQIPVFPAVGVRWSFMDQWVLDAVLPTPRLEYDWSKALTLYLGGDVDDGTYRVDRGFAAALGRRNLTGAVVEYDEVRIGAGFSWKASKALTFELEGGYLPYREFDFHRADTHFSNDDGAAYGQMSLNAQF